MGFVEVRKHYYSLAMPPEGGSSGMRGQVERLKEAGVAIEMQGGRFVARLTAEQATEEIRLLRHSLRRALEDLAERKEEIKIKSLEAMSIAEARHLTLKALRKGRALQAITFLIERNSVNTSHLRFGLMAIFQRAYGEEAVAVREQRGSSKPVYQESHIKLFRQEQLYLLAENERLLVHIRDLEHRHVQKRREKKKDKLLGVCWVS